MKNISGWQTRSAFYFIAGILAMIPVVWISRTPFFYICYLPLVLSAIFFSGRSTNKLQYPSYIKRMLFFVSGMAICEIGYSILLISLNEITLQFSKHQSDWSVLAIELILGVFIYILFFGISAGVRHIYRKIK